MLSKDLALDLGRQILMRHNVNARFICQSLKKTLESQRYLVTGFNCPDKSIFVGDLSVSVTSPNGMDAVAFASYNLDYQNTDNPCYLDRYDLLFGNYADILNLNDEGDEILPPYTAFLDRFPSSFVAKSDLTLVHEEISRLNALRVSNTAKSEDIVANSINLFTMGQPDVFYSTLLVGYLVS